MSYSGNINDNMTKSTILLYYCFKSEIFKAFWNTNEKLNDSPTFVEKINL
ncbi:MAG: hypothetical protein ACTSVI_06100 [Promethearchaeota archaeon]